MSDFTHRRLRAIGDLKKYLEMENPSVDGLISLTITTLGSARSDRIFELLRSAWLSQRYWGLAIVASFVAGTELLGEGWWTSKNRSNWPAGTDLNLDKSPDDVLFGSDDLTHGRSNILTYLEYRIAEESAVFIWGLPIDYVDLNSLEDVERVQTIPSGVSPGDRLVLAYDPGCVVDAVVESRTRNQLGTRLDLNSSRWSIPVKVWYAWCGAFPEPGPFPLPGDLPSPYDAPLDPSQADELRAHLLRLGVPELEATTWETAGDLCSALARLEERRFGDLFKWWSDAEALIDGREPRGTQYDSDEGLTTKVTKPAPELLPPR